MGFVLTSIILFIFWMLLSGDLHITLVISGIASSLFVSFISHDLLFKKARLGHSLTIGFRMLAYLPWLLWQIVLANIDLAYRTLHPSMPIDPHMIEFDTDLKTDKGVTALANSITLTPGTVTVVAKENGKFIVHAIAKAPADSLLEGTMQAKVKALEGE
ncbi:MAG: Na+/H+ antiporter subunit E [Proteobacteria bacterium]|nr:Na+/H+ antiporter subunit E [Pseudomonadota bacterium]